jgi:predicted transcriptional regulator
VEVQAELARVAKAFGKSPVALNQRGHPPLRLAAYYHLVEQKGMSVTQVGKLLGVSVSAVSKGLARLRAQLKKDRSLRACMEAMSNVKT